MDLGCKGAAIYRTISKDRPVSRSHPNKAVNLVTNIPPGSKLSLSSDPIFRSFGLREDFFKGHAHLSDLTRILHTAFGPQLLKKVFVMAE
jgi:hypothetical protein